jgi:hypothetical protein
MLDERKLDSAPPTGQIAGAGAERVPPARGFRGWLLAHYRFLYGMDLILVYLSSMFYITARIVTGKSSVPSRTMLVIVIGSGIIAALPFVTGDHFEKDFVGALSSPQSKKFKRVELIIGGALLLILAVVLAVAISHPAHRVHR